MRGFFLALLALLSSSLISFGNSQKWYLQWGWNREAYTRSTIHFVNEGQYDFYWKKVSAKDKPDFQAILTKNVTIPQFSFRIGYEISPDWYLELNHDHAKYVVTPGQPIHMVGEVQGESWDTYTPLNNDSFHFEHTNGANFWMLMAARRITLPDVDHRLSLFAKAGAGVVVPMTDVTLFGVRLNNRFHLAGYIVGVEGSVRYRVWKGGYLDLAAKTGFADYTNALTVEGGKASHSFGFIEGIFSIGWEF